MTKGIIIYGAAGAGKTTLGRQVAQRLGSVHIDLDDYIWRWDTEIPYMVLRPKEERAELLREEIGKCRHFVMSGSMASIRKEFNPLFEMGVFITVPTEVQMERLRRRETEHFGHRILPGGDMYEGNENFLREAQMYETGEPPLVCRKDHNQWTKELEALGCPVLHLDGTNPLAESADWIAAQYLKMNNNNDFSSLESRL